MLSWNVGAYAKGNSRHSRRFPHTPFLHEFSSTTRSAKLPEFFTQAVPWCTRVTGQSPLWKSSVRQLTVTCWCNSSITEHDMKNTKKPKAVLSAKLRRKASASAKNQVLKLKFLSSYRGNSKTTASNFSDYIQKSDTNQQSHDKEKTGMFRDISQANEPRKPTPDWIFTIDRRKTTEGRGLVGGFDW